MAFDNQHQPAEKLHPQDRQHPGESHALKQANDLHRAGSVHKADSGVVGPKHASGDKHLDLSDPFAKADAAASRNHQGFPGAREGRPIGPTGSATAVEAAKPGDRPNEVGAAPVGDGSSPNPSKGAKAATSAQRGEDVNEGRISSIRKEYSVRHPFPNEVGAGGNDKINSKPDGATHPPDATGKKASESNQTPDAVTSPSNANRLNQKTVTDTASDPNKGSVEDIRQNWALKNPLGSNFMPTSDGGSDKIQLPASAPKGKSIQEKTVS